MDSFQGVKLISLLLTLVAAFVVVEYPMMIYRHVGVPRFIDLFYGGTNRLAWGLVCCWLMFLMATKNLGENDRLQKC